MLHRIMKRKILQAIWFDIKRSWFRGSRNSSELISSISIKNLSFFFESFQIFADLLPPQMVDWGFLYFKMDKYFDILKLSFQTVIFKTFCLYIKERHSFFIVFLFIKLNIQRIIIANLADVRETFYMHIFNDFVWLAIFYF